MHVGPDLTSTKFTRQRHTCTSIRVQWHSRSVQEPRTYSHPLQRSKSAKAPRGSECACVLLRRMRRSPRRLRYSHRWATGGLRKATPPRPCRLEALLPAGSSSLPFPIGWPLSLAFLSLLAHVAGSMPQSMARSTRLRSWATSRLFAAGEEREERAVGGCAGDGAELGWGCSAGNLGRQWALASLAELSAFRSPEGTALPSMQTGSFLDSTEDVEPQLGIGSESKNGMMPKDR